MSFDKYSLTASHFPFLEVKDLQTQDLKRIRQALFCHYFLGKEKETIPPHCLSLLLLGLQTRKREMFFVSWAPGAVATASGLAFIDFHNRLPYFLFIVQIE